MLLLLLLVCVVTIVSGAYTELPHGFKCSDTVPRYKQGTSSVVSSSYQCQKLCDTNDDCVAATYSVVNTCLLLKYCDKVVYSGTKSTFIRRDANVSVGCSESPLWTQASETTVLACDEACNSDYRCNYFTYKPDLSCDLFSSCTGVSKNTMLYEKIQDTPLAVQGFSPASVGSVQTTMLWVCIALAILAGILLVICLGLCYTREEYKTITNIFTREPDNCDLPTPTPRY